jgi:ammonia channel protein AmtB
MPHRTMIFTVGLKMLLTGWTGFSAGALLSMIDNMQTPAHCSSADGYQCTRLAAGTVHCACYI